MKRILLLILLLRFGSANAQNTDSLKTAFEKETNVSQKTLIASKLIWDIYRMEGDLKKSLYYFNYAIKNLDKNSSPYVIINTFLNRGNVFYYQGSVDSSLVYFTRSHELSLKLKDREMECKALNNLGSSHYSLGHFELALDFLRKGLKKESEYGYLEGTYISLNNIGYLYTALKLYANAREYFRKELRNKSPLKDKLSAIYSYDGIGSTYEYEKQMDSAIYYFERSYSLASELDDNNSKMYAALSVAPLYREQKAFSKAINYLKEALVMSKQMDNKAVLGSVYASLHDVYNDLGKTEIATSYVDSALGLTASIEDPNLLKDFYKFKAQSEFRRKHSDSAFVYLEKYDILKDSLYSAEMTKIMSELQTKFEVGQKEKQIEILNEKDKQKQIVIYFVISAGIIMLGIAIYIYKVSSQRKKLNSMLASRNKEVSEQKELIEEKNKEILDSIHYAKRIQTALLANKELIETNLPESFVLFRPKDIVSGDFYWATMHNNKFYLAVCDSTGHGVPGAFMSLLNIGYLSEAIKEKNIEKPNEVFDYVRKRLIESISNEGQKDGMDGILLCIDKGTKKISYAAAHNSPVIISSNNVTALGADKMPVGKGERDESFSLRIVEAEPGSMLFLYTDGYADQFGGPKGKKFKYKKLDELLQSNSSLPTGDQMHKLNSAFDEWKGNLEQVDDVLLIGIKIS